MPSIPTGSKVLVTGANGYLATWIVRTLLEKGYSVRGTVRSEVKATHLKQIFAKYGDKFETVVVDDITKEGAFDEAVKGVDAIEHTASPFHFSAEEPEEIIAPAVNGTIGVLKSALAISSVRRIVVTSSCAAVQSFLPEPKRFSEVDWNEQAIEEVKKKGKDSSQIDKYFASKTLAEKAAWDFYEANKAKVSWDLVVLNPPYVFGPLIHDVSSPSSLGASAGDWYNAVVRPDMGGKSLEVLATDGGGWIDVRDIALAHALSLIKEEAGGERVVVSAGEWVYQDFIDTANALSPSPIPSHTNLPKGDPGAGKKLPPKIAFDTAKASKIFGPELKYRSMEETTRDTLEDFERRGW